MASRVSRSTSITRGCCPLSSTPSTPHIFPLGPLYTGRCRAQQRRIDQQSSGVHVSNLADTFLGTNRRDKVLIAALDAGFFHLFFCVSECPQSCSVFNTAHTAQFFLLTLASRALRCLAGHGDARQSGTAAEWDAAHLDAPWATSRA